jgi:hypothetical protein
MNTDKIELEYIPLQKLVKYPRNPKDHDLGAIQNAIASPVGFAFAVTVDTTTGYVVAGHGRIDSLMQMYNNNPHTPPKRIEVADNGDWLIPVNKIALQNETELQQLIIMDNKISELGGWDEPMLADVLRELADVGDGVLDVTGFDGDDLDSLLKTLSYQTPFEPNLAPSISLHHVTSGDIEEAQDKLNNNKSLQNVKTEEVMCPHCGNIFFIKVSKGC